MTILITGGAGFIGSHFAKRAVSGNQRGVVLTGGLANVSTPKPR